MAITPETYTDPDLRRDTSLKINEIFLSLQGESSRAGLPTVFIRLTGCPLRCHYCDTEYAFYAGEKKSIQEIIDEVCKTEVKHVCVTGGEPLAQKNCAPLLVELCEMGFNVSLETSGAIDIKSVDKRVSRIVDIKTPGSGEVERNLMENFNHLNDRDEVKFVICDQDDYEWSKSILEQYQLQTKSSVLFSPSYQQLDSRQLANWILEDKLEVRFQLQLHKQLWGEEPGH
jgi:7-carboxy-7-deazaguanine synthase